MEETKKGTVVVGGGFDPIHIGHIRHFKAAKELGANLVVVLNNDNWLMNKKGYVFMLQEDRVEIIKAIRYVDDVVLTGHKVGDRDSSICNELKTIMPEVYANGGDRVAGNTPEAKLCEELGIRMVFGVGGGKVQSSSWLVDEVVKKIKEK